MTLYETIELQCEIIKEQSDIIEKLSEHIILMEQTDEAFGLKTKKELDHIEQMKRRISDRL